MSPRRATRLLWGYVERSMLNAMGWRTFMVTLVVGTVVPPLVALAVWTQALPGRPELATYFVVLLLVRLVIVSYEPHTFMDHIFTGSLADYLLRPRPVVMWVLGENLAWRIWHVLLALPLILGLALVTEVRPPLGDLLLALPAVLLAAALRFVYTYLLVLTAFWTQRAMAICNAGGLLVYLLGGEAAPIPFVPAEYRVWLTALPFRSMMGFPAEVASGLAAGADVAVGYTWQVGWLAVLTLAVVLVWRTGIRRYTAFGG